MRRVKLLTRGRFIIAMLGLAAALLVFGACNGASATSTPGSNTESAGSNQPAGSSQEIVESTTGQEVVQSNPPVLVESGKAPEPVIVARTVPLGSSASATSAAIQYAPNQQVGIWVTGRGEVAVEPDLAILSAGVEARAITVELARGQAAEAMDLIMQVLSGRGIQSVDIRTSAFSIFPEYTFNDRTRQQELVGYRVNNQVSVKIRDIAGVGPIIDEVAAAGGDLVRIQGVSFTVEDTTVLESQAREKAVQDLMAKAQQFAQLAGVQLGKPVYLSEGSGFTPVVNQAFAERSFAAAAPLATTPISGGELKVSVSVQGTFAIIE